MARNWLMLLHILLIQPVICLAMAEAERDQTIEEFITHFGHREGQEALKTAEKLAKFFPEDAYYNLLKAKAIAQALENEVIDNRGSVNKGKVKKFPILIHHFNAETNAGIGKLEGDPTIKAEYLRGMLLGAKGAFIEHFFAEFSIFSPIKSAKPYQEADKYGAEGIKLITGALEKDKSLCSVRALFAKSQYEFALQGSVHKFVIKNSSSLTFAALGRDFDINRAWTWIYEAVDCNSPYYYQREIEWDKLFVYKEMLFNTHARGNLKLPHYKILLNVLIRLNERFPKNQRIKEELALIRIHTVKMSFR